MATITIYAGKAGNMPGLIKDAKTAVNNLKNEFSTLKGKVLSVNASICNLSDVVSSISASVRTQEDKADALETFREENEEFIEEAVRIDEDVADKVNQGKEDFYDKYSYLKPDCEKSRWEKFKEGCKKVAEWCKENWKSIVKIVAAVVILVALGIASVLTGGVLAVILAGAFWGALAGGLISGLMGGIMSAINGGSFLEGFADGLLSGVISGAITGAAFAGLGLAGQALGKVVSCMSKLGKTIKVVSKVTAVMSGIMDGFDTLVFGLSFFDPNNPLVKLNQKLHDSTLYNVFQVGVNALAIFTGAASSTMKCFVAGTLVAPATGLIAIECIRVGDKVIATDPDTMEQAEKTVLETFVHETDEIVHLTINGEVITSTLDHPFYVQDAGFVGAGDLYIGDKLLDAEGNTLLVEDVKTEKLDVPVKVYNFKVDEFHTYYVGEQSVFVHNAECTIEFSNRNGYDEVEYKQQLSDQQDGLNNMTVEEYLERRENYKKYGRDPDSVKYQNAARNDAINNRVSDNLEKGMSFEDAIAEADNWASDKAALHWPDQIAGGDPAHISGMGDSKINTSIGSQWKSKDRIGALDDYVEGLAKNLSPAERKTTYLDVELILTP